MEPFKNLINERTVRSMATHLQRVDRRFAAERFTSLALRGLNGLELKARAMQLCGRCRAHRSSARHAVVSFGAVNGGGAR
jgi:hypothetical protein